MQTANAAPRAFARVPANPIDKLHQIRLAACKPYLTAPAARLFIALVAGSDESGRISPTHAELAEMAALGVQGRSVNLLVRELVTHGLIEADGHDRTYAIRILLDREELREDIDTASRRLREARRERP
ncbi:hypothetical protein [Bosea sp. UC22_33]|uniref:hypothetical protein n=1 Tax=Bosea sp. UC22_33 TaxID=3350165 RepID=UPI0036730874